MNAHTEMLTSEVVTGNFRSVVIIYRHRLSLLHEIELTKAQPFSSPVILSFDLLDL